MSWGAEVLEALGRSTVAPRFALEVFGGPLGGGGLPGVATMIRPGAIVGVQTESVAVQPVSWASSVGGWSVAIQGGADLPSLARSMPRGAWVRLRLGLAGFGADPTVWPTVAVGRVQQISPRPNGLVMQALDLVASLSSRPSRNDPTLLPLFGDVAGAGSSTTISGTAYTVGDSTLYLANASGLQKDSASGGRGLLRITPSGGGDPFFLRWSAVTTAPDPDEVTIDTPSADVMGTVRANAAIGSVVEHIAYIQAHPSDCVRRILSSTGLGANGAHDTLPVEWGYGIPDDLLDHGDIGAWKSRLMASRTLDLYSATVQANAWSWLSSALNPFGFFLVSRQGAISVRAGLTPWGQPVDAQIGDREIAEVLDHQLYDGSVAAQPAGCETIGPTSTSTATAARIATLPGVRYQSYDLSAYTNHSDEAGTLAEVRGALERCLVIGERVTLRLAGLGGAALTPWDHVRVSSRHLWGRLEEAGETWTDRPCRVVSVEVDWLRGGVTVELWAPPHWTEYDR